MIRKVIHEKHYPDWTEDGQIYWCEDKGYGLTEEGKTVCVKEKEDGNNSKETS